MRKATFFVLLLFSIQTFAGQIASVVEQAKSGNIDAMYQVFFEIAKKNSPDHPITEAEEDLSRYWLIKAGENNNWRAAQVLQLCYEKGCWGMPIDIEKSKHYKSVVKKFGPKSALKRDAPQGARL